MSESFIVEKDSDQNDSRPVRVCWLPTWMNSAIVIPETRFVMEAVRSAVNGNADCQVPGSQAEPDWDLVLQEALRLGVAPLINGFLVERCSESVPPSILSKCRKLVRYNAMRNLSMTAELFVIERLCAARGIQIVPFKGPTLTDLIYGDLSLRAFTDLDVWVEKGNVLAVSRLLHERGYIADLEWESSGDEVFLQTCYQMQFVNAEANLIVELHWGFLPKYLARDFSQKQVKSNLIVTKPAGKSLVTLKPEYLLLYLCLHGAKHPWETLGQIVDVACLINRFPELNWGEVMDQARTQGVERMLWLGLLLARDLVGVQLPPDVNQRINNDHAVIGLAATAATWLFGGGDGPQNKPRTVIYHFRLQERVWEKLSYCWRLFAVPTYSDWKMIRLPVTLLTIYPLLRPFRLIKKYAWPF